MRFPLTRDAIAADFRGCCCCNKRVVELETAEEKEQWMDNVEAQDDKAFVELEIAEERIQAREEKLLDRTLKLDDEPEDKVQRLKKKEAKLKKKEADDKLEKTRIDSMTILDNSDWKEFDDCYTRTYHDINDDGMREGEEKTEVVDMSKERPCSYSSKTDRYGRVLKTKIIEAPPASDKNSSRKPGVECNGITLRQLRAVMENIKRRCVAERWTGFNDELLTPEKVNLYDVNKYIILPYTSKKKSSFVRALPSTAGPQPPRFFVSHWWGEPVIQFIACLEQAVLDFKVNDRPIYESMGGGMTADTPVWVCAYANNQWSLGDDITEDPKESGFTKAMNVAKGRTITILDEEGIVFSRIWCIFELFLTLVGTKGSKVGIWAVYTAYTHTYTHPDDNKPQEERKAIGIISGGATSDCGGSDYITAREAAFPNDLIMKSLSIRVEVAEASVEEDRVHILNSIVGRSADKINTVPLITHDKYEELNNSLSGTFASSMALLARAANEPSDEGWKKMITALSLGRVRGRMTFDFESGGIWDGLTAVRATQLITHVPLTIDELIIRYAEYGVEFMEALVERVKQLYNLKMLEICETYGDKERDQEIGLRLAEILATNTTIKELDLYETDLIGADNIEQWGDALMRNNALTEMTVNDEIIDQMKSKTRDRTLKLEIE